MADTTTRYRVASAALRIVAVATALAMCTAPKSDAQTTDTITLRGHVQTLHLYGQRGGYPIVLSSGDGGWMHLGPQTAQLLANKGFFVVGFDVKAYLESFTTGKSTLRPEDEPGDFRTLAEYATRGGSERPILVGVSEGAGLSVLAAGDPATRRAIAGVIGLGMPNVNELGWRWRDSLIYLTHTVPNEPTFTATAIINRVSPAPIASIQSTRDEFVPLPEAQRVMEAAKEPKRLWVVEASDHRFSNNQPEFERRLLEAIEWVRSHTAS